MLYKKTHSLINKPNTYSKQAVHLTSLLLICIGFCTTAICGFGLSEGESIGMGLFKLAPLIILPILPIAVFIFALGVWLSKLPLKIIVLLSSFMSVPFFLGKIYYGHRADNSDGYYFHSDFEIAAVIYGFLFLIPLVMAIWQTDYSKLKTTNQFDGIRKDN